MAKKKEGDGADADTKEKNGERAADREEVNALVRKATGLHMIHASEQRARRTDVMKAALEAYIEKLQTAS